MTTRLFMLKGKIHGATVTDVQLDYEGSITIDADLLAATGILPYERVDVWDRTNGNRLSTYAIRGKPGSGEVCVNGAAGHLVQPGDTIIIAAFATVDECHAAEWSPRVAFLGERNSICRLTDRESSRRWSTASPDGVAP